MLNTITTFLTIVPKQEGNGPIDFGLQELSDNLSSYSGGLKSHGSLQTSSEVPFDLGIELSDLNYLCYPCYHASMASNCIQQLDLDGRLNVIH